MGFRFGPAPCPRHCGAALAWKQGFFHRLPLSRSATADPRPPARRGFPPRTPPGAHRRRRDATAGAFHGAHRHWRGVRRGPTSPAQSPIRAVHSALAPAPLRPSRAVPSPASRRCPPQADVLSARPARAPAPLGVPERPFGVRPTHCRRAPCRPDGLTYDREMRPYPPGNGQCVHSFDATFRSPGRRGRRGIWTHKMNPCDPRKNAPRKTELAPGRDFGGESPRPRRPT